MTREIFGRAADLVLHIHMVDREAFARIGSVSDRGVKLSCAATAVPPTNEAPLFDDGYLRAMILFSFTITGLSSGQRCFVSEARLVLTGNAAVRTDTRGLPFQEVFWNSFCSSVSAAHPARNHNASIRKTTIPSHNALLRT